MLYRGKSHWSFQLLIRPHGCTRRYSGLIGAAKEVNVTMSVFIMI